MKTPLGTEVDLDPGHIVLDGDPAPPRKGHSNPPLFGPCLLWPRSPILATAELLLHMWKVNECHLQVTDLLIYFTSHVNIYEFVTLMSCDSVCCMCGEACSSR